MKTTSPLKTKHLVWLGGQNAQCQPKQAELPPIGTGTLVMIIYNLHEDIWANFKGIGKT